MAEQTFVERVEDLTKLTVSDYVTDAAFVQFVVDGTNDIVRKIKDIAPRELVHYATKKSDDDAGSFDVKGVFLFAELLDGAGGIYRMCEEIPPNMAQLYADTNSLHKATYINPKCYVIVNKVYTIPTYNVVNTANIYYFVADSADTIGDYELTNFPKNMHYALGLYLSIKVIDAYMSNELFINKDSDLYKLTILRRDSFVKDYNSVFVTMIKDKSGNKT